MDPNSKERRRYRFGMFEAEPGAGELRKNGSRVKLQEQPFRVLMLLLERPGEVVSREEIREALWSGDTFVDFDHGLNTVINKLRDALNDTASNPRFVETLARRGYRFIAPVEVIGEGARVAQAPEPSVAARFSLLTHPDELPSASRSVVRGLFALIQLMYLCFYVVSLAKLGSIETLVTPTVSRPSWILVLVLVTAMIGIPTRLFLLAGVAFHAKELDRRFLRLFPFVFPLDELWALAPLLAVNQLGVGLALAATAALLFVPFAQRTLILMAYRSGAVAGQRSGDL